MFKSKRQKNISLIVFGIYLLLLTWLILFKFNTNLSEVARMRSVNLIPFSHFKGINGGWSTKEIIYNVLVFVPFGMCMEMLLQKSGVFMKICFGFLLSLSFEVMQYVFSIGASDISDLIGNTLGCLIGILFYKLLELIFKKNTVTVVNVSGILAEIGALIMLTILLVSNG